MIFVLRLSSSRPVWSLKLKLYHATNFGVITSELFFLNVSSLLFESRMDFMCFVATLAVWLNVIKRQLELQFGSRLKYLNSYLMECNEIWETQPLPCDIINFLFGPGGN